jgi:outer membrane protein assembly factor BamB
LSESQTTDLAYDASQNRLYALYDQDGVNLRYYNVATAETTPIYVDPPAGYSFNSAVLGAGIAAADGFIYANVMGQDSNYYLGKFTVPDGQTSVVAELVAAVNWSTLDVTGEIRDMIVKDGVLYIIAIQSYPGDGYTTYSVSLESRGRLTAISTSNLAQLWETGFSATGLPSNPSKEFYGPTRFVGVAPKKLYIADEGFRWEYTTQMTGNPINVDRVVEVDLDQHAITAVGLEGAATFFQDFSTYTVYSSDYYNP